MKRQVLLPFFMLLFFCIAYTPLHAMKQIIKKKKQDVFATYSDYLREENEETFKKLQLIIQQEKEALNGKFHFNGQNIFIKASNDNRPEIIKVLLATDGIDPNIKENSSQNNTALHIASKKGFLEIVKLLINKTNLYTYNAHNQYPILSALYGLLIENEYNTEKEEKKKKENIYKILQLFRKKIGNDQTKNIIENKIEDYHEQFKETLKIRTYFRALSILLD